MGNAPADGSEHQRRCRLLVHFAIDLRGYDASTASITFSVAADDDYAIALNGADTGIARGGAYSARVTHTIATGWAPGLNTLRVTINNSGGGPTGLT